MAKQVTKKEPVQVGPLAIAGAVVALALLFGFYWYHFLGPGVDSGMTHFTKNPPPMESVPPAIRAMYANRSKAGQGAPGMPVTPR